MFWKSQLNRAYNYDSSTIPFLTSSLPFKADSKLSQITTLQTNNNGKCWLTMWSWFSASLLTGFQCFKAILVALASTINEWSTKAVVLVIIPMFKMASTGTRWMWLAANIYIKQTCLTSAVIYTIHSTLSILRAIHGLTNRSYHFCVFLRGWQSDLICGYRSKKIKLQQYQSNQCCDVCMYDCL